MTYLILSKYSNIIMVESDSMFEFKKHTFKIPEKMIKDQETNKKFINSKTYQNLVYFINLYQDSIKSKTSNEDLKVDNEIILEFYSFLDYAEKLTEQHPALNQSEQRYGNVAFRDWYASLEKYYDETFKKQFSALINKKFQFEPKDEKEKSVLDEIKPYLFECFGNSKRIDYGTGHELNFFMVLVILTITNVFEQDSIRIQIHFLFKKYIGVCKHLQSFYRLEPAGSKGVYGLDDYFFLSFLFGASELIDNNKITPEDIQRDLDVIKELGKEFMFFDAVYSNLYSKKGHLSLHSPVLFQISNVKIWGKVAKGLVKMYEDEVLKKIVVTQHFYFGSIFVL